MDAQMVSPLDHSSDDNSLPFDPEPSCLIDFGLHCVACDARSAILADNKGPRAIEHAQLALDIERLRRRHAQHCPDCNAGATA